MQAYQFLKECGTFWVTTIDKDRPASRPFGAVMERGGELYISTSDTKAVYKQLKTNPAVQLTAIKPGTREWIRIDGEAIETSDLDAKAQMLKDCPRLRRHYSSPDAEGFALFRIAKSAAFACTEEGKFPLD
jgi:pyridoxamine 5'-phosphate oxidase family protein